MIGLRHRSRRIAERLRSFRADASGLALIEFAILLPTLLLMYLAGYQLSDAIACNRRVTISTRTAADLTTQVKCLSSSDVTTILTAAGMELAPYKSAKAMIRLTELSTDASGNTTVAWSQAVNGTGRVVGSAYTLPGTIKVNGTYLIMSEVNYAYSPAATFGIVGNLGLSDRIFMSPRVSDSIPNTGCSS